MILQVPYFIDELTVCDMDLGSDLPQFQKLARPPYLDEHGVWFFFDVTYHGGLQMSLETKVNLMKLKRLSQEEVVPDFSLNIDEKK